jgi:hypothetical protein
MNKPAFWIWLLSAPVLTGALIVPLLLVPSIQRSLGLWILGATALSALIAVPFSMRVGRAIE